LQLSRRDVEAKETNNQNLTTENRGLKAQALAHNRAVREKDQRIAWLTEQFNSVNQSNDTHRAQLEAALAALAALTAERDLLRGERLNLTQERNRLVVDLRTANNDKARLTAQLATANESVAN